jgi:RHS repeat-associated protein
VLSGAETAFRVSIDANGNLTGDGTKTYEWDAENRLLAVKQGGNALASFTYDGKGRRATKAVGGVSISYLYSGAQFLEERPSAGPTKRYVYGSGVDQPLAQVIAGTPSYNLADHLGSVIRTTDTAGTAILTRAYDPWGNLLQGSATSGYAFTGREWDSETSLYYYRARYYAPQAGRFLIEDPIGLAGGANYYAYASGRVTSYTDPLGLRIHINLSVGPAQFGVPRTCSGDAGGTCYLRTGGTLGPCRRQGKCYGFDVTANIKIWEEFSVTQQVAVTPGTSANTPGLSLQQHEDLHLSDFRLGFSDAAINSVIQTDDFKTVTACNNARRQCIGRIDSFITGVALFTHVFRDVW